jgi:uncharacterized repeat protein (TIGR03803 family)
VTIAGCVRSLSVLPLLLAFAVLTSPSLQAQNFKTLYSFTGFNNGTNNEGADPVSGVVLIGNTLYGTTSEGGAGYGGTVYSVDTAGTVFHLVFTFLGLGAPTGTFVISDNILYTTSDTAPAQGFGGSIIEVPLDGSSQFPINFYYFAPVFGDGTSPDGLILSDNLLYGVTSSGGQFGNGTVYVYGGLWVTNLYSFSGNDGANPNGSLALYNGTLYGVTRIGGSWGNGTVYALNTDGSGFKTLHHFSGSTNAEGANPLANLVLSGDTLFGTTFSGGAYGYGTIFSVSTNGTGFTTLYSFTDGSDGANPAAALNLSANTLYGTTANGGTSGLGTIFALETDGSGFTTLHSFNKAEGTPSPAKMVLSGNTLYGTTVNNVPTGTGTVFSLSLGVAPPRLSITPAGPNVVLSWPTNGNFLLQSATSLVSAPIWIKVSTVPIIISGLNTITNSISEAQRFYRLSQ